MKMNFIDKINDSLFMNQAKRLGAFTDFGDGSGIIDMDIMNASANRFRIVLVVATIGASVLGHVLGSRSK